MNDIKGEIPFLSLSGSRAEIGQAHGEEFRTEIRNLIDSRTHLLLGYFPQLTKEGLSEVCKTAFDYVRRDTPEVYLEVSATAKASGSLEHDMIVCGGYTDLLDYFRFKYPKNHFDDPGECTTLLDVKNGMIWGTWDSNPEAMDCSVLLRRSFKNRDLTVLSLTTAGWPAQQGVNSNGIAFAINNLMPRVGNRAGLNYIAALAQCAECQTIDEFLRFSRSVVFSGGHAYVLVDGNKQGVVVETTVEGSANITLNEDHIQTNHYILEPLLDDNSRYPFLKGSIDRYQEMKAMKKGFGSQIEFIEELKRSKFVNKKDPNGSAFTCAHFCIDAKNRRFSLRKGPADGAPLFTLSC